MKQAVLVVEDQAYVAMELEQQLKDMGFESISVCLTYDEACAKLEEQAFGLVIFDINVGGKMCFGLISEALDKGSAVVTISAYLPNQEGMPDTAFLSKPIFGEDLADAIAFAKVKAGLRQSATAQGLVSTA